MLGLCGIIAVQLGLICLSSYWISWDMQRKGKRPAFRTQLWNDLVELFGKYGGAIRNSGFRSLALKSDRGEPANRRHSFGAPVLAGKPAARKS